MDRNSSVSKVSRLGLGDFGSVLGSGRDFSFFHHFQTACVYSPASNPVYIEGPFSEVNNMVDIRTCEVERTRSSFHVESTNYVWLIELRKDLVTFVKGMFCTM
jgi:hypothetical protein